MQTDTDNEDTSMYDEKARTEIAALTARVRDLEKQTPRLQHAGRESRFGKRIAAEIQSEPVIQQQIEKALATIQEEARKQLETIKTTFNATSKWIEATKKVAKQAEAAVKKVNKKQADTDAQLKTMDAGITTLKTDIETAWVRASDKINKAVQSIDTILNNIEQRAVTDMTQRVDTKFRKLETKCKNLDTRLKKIEDTVNVASSLTDLAPPSQYKI